MRSKHKSCAATSSRLARNLWGACPVRPGSTLVLDCHCATRLQVYRHPKAGRLFHAPDLEPSLEVAAPVLHISGLNDAHLPHPLIHPLVIKARPGLAATGSGPGGAFMGNDFRAAYMPGVS